MYLSRSDEEVIGRICDDGHISVLAAAYTIYMQMTPNNKKPIQPREFYREFKDNWHIFAKLETELVDEN